MSVEVAVNALRSRMTELLAEKEHIQNALDALTCSNGSPAEPKPVNKVPVAVKEKKERKPRDVGVSRNVLAYIREHGESNTADVAKALGLEASQVAQALTAGKKKGLFESLGRGVWKLA